MFFRPLQRFADTAFGVIPALVAVVAICSTATAQTSPTDPGITAPSPFASSPPSVTEAVLAANDEYVVYPFKLVNGGSSAINFIRISGSVTHTFTQPAGFAAAFEVVSPAPFTCTASTTTNSISFSCSAPAPSNSLASGQTLNLPIAFRLPKTRHVGEQISFAATALFREGKSTGPGGNNDSALTATSITPVAPFDNDEVAAVIPLQTGARFFTGKKGVPQGGSDRVGTLVDAPITTGTYANGTIVETSVATCPVPGVTSCKNTIDLSIVNANGNKQRFELSPYLVIYLRLDASAIKGSFNNMVIYYNGGAGFEAVPPCVNGADPLAGMERCVYDRRVFRKNDPEVKTDPLLLGDGQATILAKENGRFAW